MSEQVKGIPELKHLQPEQYASWLRKAIDPEWNEEKFGVSARSKPERAAASLALELRDSFERIARSEQALAALEADMDSALEYQQKESAKWNTMQDDLEGQLAASQQQVAALEARNRELESALRGIESLCADEITTRFGGHSHKSEDELGRNSRVYSLLVVPRNMARAALKGAS